MKHKKKDEVGYKYALNVRGCDCSDGRFCDKTVRGRLTQSCALVWPTDMIMRWEIISNFETLKLFARSIWKDTSASLYVYVQGTAIQG